MNREQLLKKHLWKCYSSKGNKQLYRCIDIIERKENYGDADIIQVRFLFETLYIESGNTKVNYGRESMLDTYMDMLKPIKESEFEALRDLAIVIIRGGVIGDSPVLRSAHIEEELFK